MSLPDGSIVIVNLREPTEKLWGFLDHLNSIGIRLRALNLSSFDDWLAQAASGQRPEIGLATMFIPMFRVERIFLDEQVGEVESYRQLFERRVGISVEAFVGLPAGDEIVTREVPS